MNSKRILFIFLIASGMFLRNVFAEETYLKRLEEKLTRGVTNVVLSPVEFLTPLEQDVEKDQVLRSAGSYLVKGIPRTLGRLFV